MSWQILLDYAMTQDVGQAVQLVTARYGKDDRVYSTTFSDTGKWYIVVLNTAGKIIARFGQDEHPDRA